MTGKRQRPGHRQRSIGDGAIHDQITPEAAPQAVERPPLPPLEISPGGGDVQGQRIGIERAGGEHQREPGHHQEGGALHDERGRPGLQPARNRSAPPMPGEPPGEGAGRLSHHVERGGGARRGQDLADLHRPGESQLDGQHGGQLHGQARTHETAAHEQVAHRQAEQ